MKKKMASGDANDQRLESEFSHLPWSSGLVVLLGPWMRHVVIIGSAPAQALSDRTSADLPRCAFVAFSMLCRGLVSADHMESFSWMKVWKAVWGPFFF